MTATIKLIASAIILIGTSAHAEIDRTTTWTGLGSTTTVGADVYGNWTHSGSWTDGIAINTTLRVNIGEVAANGGRVILNQAADGFSNNELWIGTSRRPKIGELILSGGILQHVDGNAALKTTRIGDEGDGVFVQTGGTFFMNEGQMRIGNNNTQGGRGLYDISGGILSTNGGLYPGGNIFINRDKIHSAPVNGAELRISGTANIDLGIASSGGPALGFGTGNGSPGSSVLSITGPDATIHIDSIQMRNAGSTALAPGPYLDTNRVRFTFDQAGVSTIHLTGSFAFDPGTGPVEVSAVLAQGKLEVDYISSTEPAVGATFDLMIGDHIVQDPTFALDPAAATNWSLAIVGTQTPGDGSNDVLRLTFTGGPLPPVPVKGLVAYWPFEAAGNLQPDLSGNGNAAAPNAGAAWILDSERGSGVMEFDGNDSYLEVADSPSISSLSLTGDFTIAAWINPADYANSRGIVSKSEANRASPFDIYLSQTSGEVHVWTGSPGADGRTPVNLSVAAGEWHHLAVTMTGGVVRTYYDGVLGSVGTNLAPLLDSTATLRIGNRDDLGTDFLGRMDDVAIFNIALSQSQLKTIMAGDFSQFGVTSGFAIRSIDVSGGQVTLTWPSQTGTRYELRSSTDLSLDFANWTLVEDDIRATEPLNSLTIPQPAAPSLFYRLRKYPILPEVVIAENFEDGNGGFTVETAGGTAWAHGAPNSPDQGGGATTAGNGGSARCWGTNLTGGYGAGTDTKLRSPVIDLTGVAGATLSFAQSLDIEANHNLVVNVIDEATDTLLQPAIHISTPSIETSSAWTIVRSVAINGGMKVRIEWHFTGISGGGNYNGAYIDDVLILKPGF